MKKGKINKYNHYNGWGEIKADNGRIITFNKRAIEGGHSQIAKDMEVEYEESENNTFNAKRVILKVSQSSSVNPSPHQKMVPDFKKESKPAAKNEKASLHAQTDPMSDSFPYTFAPIRKKGKEIPTRLHDKLNDQCYDIAFEIEWKTITPTAVNPCSEGKDKCCPANDKNEYAGYDNRWLMIDGENNGKRLAISPFTVKSAIANGFANLIGGCYRVTERIEPHPDVIKDGHYYYTGKYKRYRVSMRESKPGILLEDIRDNGNGTRHVKIKQVIEIYYDSNTLPSFKLQKHKKYYAIIDSRDQNRLKITDASKIREANKNDIKKNEVEVFYYGEYVFGMNETLKPGNLYKKHYHRFYTDCSLSNGQRLGEFEGDIINENFFSKEELKKIVYAGNFTRLAPSVIEKGVFESILSPLLHADVEKLEKIYKNKDSNGNPKLKGDISKLSPEILEIFKEAKHDYDTRENFKIWHEDLSTLKKDSWVYFVRFNKQVTNIGKNYQFKALFLHEDTIPENNKTCKSRDYLCPRCSLFGMTDQDKNKNKSDIGLKGRFKSSTLINSKELKEDTINNYSIAIIENGKKENINVTVKCWKHNNTIICQQHFLPLMGGPKPNKRDVDGYYDKDGLIKGAKQYRHTTATFDLVKLINETNIKDKIGNPSLPYAHNLRNYAVVCNKDETFTGVVGVENASLDEIAALILLLHTDLSNHGFKIGVGKPLGLGSIHSKIKKVWIREKTAGKELSKWMPIEEFDLKNKKIDAIDAIVEGISTRVETLKKASQLLFNITGKPSSKLEYPLPIQLENNRKVSYWDKAKRR